MDYRYSTFWPRFGAALIDGLVFLPLDSALELLYKLQVPLVTYAVLVVEDVLFFAYSIYLHGRYGQTIGKKLMKVKVISIDESPLTMRQAWLRDSISICILFVYLIYAVEPVFSGIAPDSREFNRHIPRIIVNAILLITTLELATMLTNRKRRSLHDYIAGSVVVRRSNPAVQGTLRDKAAQRP